MIQQVNWGRERVMEILPHREPMLLVDGVRGVEVGKSIDAFFYVRPDMEILKGHFPGNPILPGVYSVESMAQAKAMHDELEALYNPHVDFERVNAIADHIAEELLSHL